MLNNYIESNGAVELYTFRYMVAGNLNSQPNLNQNNLFQIRRSFIQELKLIYWAEKRIQKLLPRLQRAGALNTLVQGFKTHCKQSVEHMSRIGQIFKMIEEKPSGKRCHQMVNIINDSAKVMHDTKKRTSERDLALAHIAQRIEHYQINKYSTLLQLSTLLEEYKIISLIELTLTEEREAEEAFLAINRDT